MKLENFDQSIVFAFSMFFVVVGMVGLFSWVFAGLRWTGPLGLLKGGVMQ